MKIVDLVKEYLSSEGIRYEIDAKIFGSRMKALAVCFAMTRATALTPTL